MNIRGNLHFTFILWKFTFHFIRNRHKQNHTNQKKNQTKYYQDKNYKLLAQNVIWYATTCDYGVIDPEDAVSVQFEPVRATTGILLATLSIQ